MKKFFSNLPYFILAILLAPIIMIIAMYLVGLILSVPVYAFSYLFEYLNEANYINSEGETQFVGIMTVVFWAVWVWAMFQYDKFKKPKA